MKKEATLTICVTLYSVLVLFEAVSCEQVCNCKNVNFTMNDCLHRCNTFSDKVRYSKNNLTVFIERGYGAFYLDDDYGTLVGHCIFCNVLDLKSTMTGEMVMIQQDGKVLSECLDNAEGFFCSQCKNGYHLNLGRRCGKCDNLARDWTLFILAQFGSVVVLLVVLLLMKWSLVGREAMATIFFAQMVTTTMDIDGEGLIPIANLTSHAYNIKSAYHFIYQPFNLNFFYPFVNDLCLIRNSSYLWYFVIQYAVAAWPLILCAAVRVFIYVLQHNRDRIPKRIPLFRSGSNIAESFGNILASSILLSYNKLILISAYILAPNPLLDQYGNVVKWVSFYDPNLEYFKQDHIGYSIVAVIILLCLIPLPVLFLLRLEIPGDGKGCCNVWRRFLLSVVYPFQRHYRSDWSIKYLGDGSGWIPALYFALRLFFILTFVLGSIGYKLIMQYIIQMLASLVMLFVVMSWPYKKKWHFICDMLPILGLIAINICNIQQFHQMYSGENLSLPIFVTQIVLVFLPVVLWSVVVLVNLIMRCRQVYTRKDEKRQQLNPSRYGAIQ